VVCVSFDRRGKILEEATTKVKVVVALLYRHFGHIETGKDDRKMRILDPRGSKQIYPAERSGYSNSRMRDVIKKDLKGLSSLLRVYCKVKKTKMVISLFARNQIQYAVTSS
jgi:hypothetical protein